jgi:hypothetical protein
MTTFWRIAGARLRPWHLVTVAIAAGAILAGLAFDTTLNRPAQHSSGLPTGEAL